MKNILTGLFICIAITSFAQVGSGFNGGGGSNFDSLFNSNRPMLRTYETGVNIGGTTIREFLEYPYFAAPTISMGSLSPSVIEIGTTQAYTISGTTTNNGNATLSSGILQKTFPSSATLNSFGSSTTYSQGITFAPLQTPSGDYTEAQYRFRASQNWSKGTESGTTQSPQRTIKGVYPILYGLSNTDLSSTGNPYTELTKLIEAEGDKTVTLTGSGFIYFAIPKTWSDFDLSLILDHNGFNVTGSFTAFDITVSSSGLTNDWTNEPYKLYKLNTTTTASGFDYQFNQ